MSKSQIVYKVVQYTPDNPNSASAYGTKYTSCYQYLSSNAVLTYRIGRITKAPENTPGIYIHLKMEAAINHALGTSNYRITPPCTVLVCTSTGKISRYLGETTVPSVKVIKLLEVNNAL